VSDIADATNLAAVLAQLKSYRLLDRASYVKAGDVEVHLGPPAMRDADPVQPVSPEEERAELARMQYGASRGAIPGLT
jgi:hypothetical protein